MLVLIQTNTITCLDNYREQYSHWYWYDIPGMYGVVRGDSKSSGVDIYPYY